MKNFKFLIIIIIISVCNAENTNIIGKIFSVDNHTIQIKVLNTDNIKVENKIMFYYKTLSGQEMKTGEGKVTKISNEIVYATSVDMYIPPAVGMVSKIETSPKKDGHEEAVRQDQHNAYSTLEDDKDTSVNSQYYVDKAKKMADDLYKNSKNYSKEKRKTLWNEVIKNIQIAISMNNAEAYYALAMIYEDGYGDIERDMGKMVHNIRISADRGYAEAQYTLGEMYTSGDEVANDREQAILWLQKAAKQGHKDAKYELEKLMKKKVKKQPPTNNNINDLYDLLD
jgi:hypothetical protein